MKSLADKPWNWMRSGTGDAHGRVRLNGRRIYILPTKYGLMFAVLLVLMLIGAVNYNNQPAYLLTFILVGVSANAMFQTWRNLVGLQVECLPAEPVFAGQELALRFRLAQDGTRGRYGIQLFLDGVAAIEDMPGGSARTEVTLEVPTRRRGPFNFERLVVSSRYPFGLFNAWAYAKPSCHALVYPKPAGSGVDARPAPVAGEAGARSTGGSDDFAGLREYRPGDAPRHIDWKRLAAERGLLTRQFVTEVGAPLLLDWAALAGRDTEWKIALLTRAVLDTEQAGLRYALALPGINIPAGRGATQLRACLETLARFEADGA